MKIAFVAPFFGRKASGGAEAECRNTAINLARSGIEVEVLTTCALDLTHGWNTQYHREGVFREDGLIVRRFTSQYVDPRAFAKLNTRILDGELLSKEEERCFISMHVNSEGLYRFLSAHCEEYEKVCFIPYLFGTSFYGSMFCPGKAILIPCLHNEPYARMNIFSQMFDRVDKIVFHTRAEQLLAEKLYESAADKGILAGEGIETGFESDAARFRDKYGITGPMVLYAGRKDQSKNVHTLIEYFARFTYADDFTDTVLVLIGPGNLPVPSGCEHRIMDLGFVSEQDKKDAYSAADVFCQPSLNESFSIVMMEAWFCKTPCLVHGNCAVTRGHVISSGGGLYFENCAEFKKCLEFMLSTPETTVRMGEAGKKYAQQYDWDKIIARYRTEVFHTCQ